MKWWPISRRFDEPRGLAAEERLRQAYANIFRTSNDDAQLVLADLADFTGFYRVNGQGIPPDDRAFSDGKRAAFGRLFRFLNLTEEERSELAEAARREDLRIRNPQDDFE